MTDPRWERLQELFHRATELDEEQRDRYLAAECGEDEGLRRQVMSLIAAAEEDDDLGRPVRDVARELATEGNGSDSGGEAGRREGSSGAGAAGTAGHDAGSRIGPYRIVRELGRGGMGAVYLAERADGAFEQKVALKLIGGAMGGLIAAPGAVERFLEERQILARLDHPGIARLLDGGATPEGVPYFAMEWVDGEPIHAWCDRQRLPFDRRLELFLEVCDAVHHAHRGLVVHRDLKPSNILVTAEGRPKLLDFGIAKLLDPAAAHPALTRLGDRPMTPEYASPEQVLGEPVSTASDVYGLGLLLYELLTGRKAHRIESGEMTEIRRAVCEQTPTRPSTAAAKSESGAAADRRSSPARLGKRLAGDLDTIVLTALRKEPERRYASVDRLADDVRRHLAGLPVAARGDGLGYRAGRFLRRHWAGAAAALLVLASLVGGLVATTLQARRAEREARRAEAVLGFVVDLLETSDPGEARGREVTVREVLDRAPPRIESELALQPRLAAELERVVSALYRKLGDYREAEVAARSALGRLEDLEPPRARELGRTRLEIGRLRLAEGNFATAQTELESALALLERAGAPADEQVGALLELGNVARRQGDLPRARELFERGLKRLSNSPETARERLAELHHRLAYLELEAGGLDPAEVHFQAALDHHRRSPGDGTVAEAETLSGYAWLLHTRGGRGDEALELASRALAIHRRDLGPRHLTIADALNTLAPIQDALGRFDEAEANLHEALAMMHDLGLDEHPLVASLWSNLSSLLFRQKLFERAVEVQRQALERLIAQHGPDHPWIGRTRGVLAYMRHQAGDPLAEDDYRTALAQLLESRESPHHPDVAYVRHGLGRLLMESGRCQEARPLLASAFEDLVATYGEEHSFSLRTEVGLAACMLGDGELDAAERHLEHARESYSTNQGAESWQVAQVDLLRAELLGLRGRGEEGRELYRRAAAHIRETDQSAQWLEMLAARIGRRLEA